MKNRLIICRRFIVKVVLLVVLAAGLPQSPARADETNAPATTIKMTLVGNSWKGLGPDRLHLVPEGYELWTSEMEPLLAKLLAGNP